jgi:sec-independent protein translocase protein TatB
MFGVDSAELVIIAVAALIFIGPKELPGALRTLGRWIGSVRAHARHFTGGIETMMREAELAEMEAKWRAQTQAIEAMPAKQALAAETPPVAAERAPS